MELRAAAALWVLCGFLLQPGRAERPPGSHLDETAIAGTAGPGRLGGVGSGLGRASAERAAPRGVRGPRDGIRGLQGSGGRVLRSMRSAGRKGVRARPGAGRTRRSGGSKRVLSRATGAPFGQRPTRGSGVAAGSAGGGAAAGAAEGTPEPAEALPHGALPAAATHRRCPQGGGGGEVGPTAGPAPFRALRGPAGKVI